MAHVATNTTDTSVRPLMDRLTHAVIKETSKSLKYYIDIKRRENAFVLNPKSSAADSIPLKAKLIYGTTKEYPSLYNSQCMDKDFRNLLPTFQKKQKQNPNHSTSMSPEKQMCREELNFHMRSYKFSPRESPKLSELRLLKSTIRSSSSCGVHRESRSRSTLKLTKNEQEQLVDDAADILASMVKSRRPTYGSQLAMSQTPPIYISQTLNSSPRQIDNESNVQRSINYPIGDLRMFSVKQQSKKEKRATNDPASQTTSIIQKTKLITRGLLCEYRISVTTGNCNGASTTAPIRIKLYGTNGHTVFHELVYSETHRIPFLKDQTDLFTVQTYHVGDLVGITIGHDKKDMRASWFLSKVSIDDPIRNKTYIIPCNAWLSIKSIDQKTMREFHVASAVLEKKKISIDEHREENESRSDYSTRTIEGTLTSNETNASENDLLRDERQTKKYRKQHHVSIGPTTTIAKKLSCMSVQANNVASVAPTSTTATETHLNQDDLLLPPARAPVRLIHSPALSATSSDTEIEGNTTSRTRSTTRTPSPTFHQARLQPVSENDTLQTKSKYYAFKRHSNDDDRPPGRLEKRLSPLSVSPEWTNKDKDQNNKTNLLAFFE